MTPEQYDDGLLVQCGASSPEYAILKNGLVIHQEDEGRSHRMIAITCEIAEAAQLYAAATRFNPTIVTAIAKDIALARGL
jgi:hypothetical protein